MKNVIISGAGSMIGTALTELLLSQGISVTALLRKGSEKLSHIDDEKLRKVYCDLSEYQSLQLNEKYDAFFHLGWASTFGEERNNTFTQVKNIEYTLNAVKLAERSGCEVFVTAGSQAEYGLHAEPLKGDSSVDPKSGYGIAKYAAGKLSLIMCSQGGMRHCHARIFSVYGERDRDETLVSSCIDSMLQGESPSLTGCEQMWDYIYVSDAANALFLIAQKGKNGSVYCVGSGECRPLSQYVEAIKRETGFNGKIKYFDREYAENQVMYLCADITELSKDTGFVPSVTFEEGIRRTVSFRKDRCNK